MIKHVRFSSLILESLILGSVLLRTKRGIRNELCWVALLSASFILQWAGSFSLVGIVEVSA